MMLRRCRSFLLEALSKLTPRMQCEYSKAQGTGSGKAKTEPAQGLDMGKGQQEGHRKIKRAQKQHIILSKVLLEA